MNEKINGIHIYQGLCPDEINGPYSRDPDCPCCRALLWLEQAPQNEEKLPLDTEAESAKIRA